jgi:hypothetical protein
MKCLAAGLGLTLAVTVAWTTPALAGGSRNVDWGPANWSAGVQMYLSEPSATDLHVHVRFKRVGGEGLREVRMGEREKVAGTHHYGPYRYTHPVRLDVGEKVVFTTEGALVCEPAKAPVGVTIDMRIKQPGRPWGRWVTWVSADDRLLDCDQSQ